jgi:hypothetical protein
MVRPAVFVFLFFSIIDLYKRISVYKKKEEVLSVALVSYVGKELPVGVNLVGSL